MQTPSKVFSLGAESKGKEIRSGRIETVCEK